MRQTGDVSGWNGRLREAGALLVLLAIACRSFLPLLATADLVGSESSATVAICTASGVQTAPLDQGVPGEEPSGQERHADGSLDCLLCCARTTAAVLAPPVERQSFPQFLAVSYLELPDLLVGECRIGSKGPRGPPVV